MLTPQKIQDLSDPIESVYIAMTNELLVNIGRHITSPTWTHTAAWEIQKLSELGQLTQENAAIINRWIKSLPQEIRDTMEETRRVALEGIEKQMERAAKAGYLTPPERDSTIDVLREYSQQAADQLNLVNTTMLQSSLDQYARMVQLTAEIERQAEQTQAILNEAAGSVATGTETRTQALNRAIRRISEEGLAGFYDKAGRSWSPEAYVNMDIRTTVHNVAIQSVKNRMEDYNTQVFQVSAHAGARPLCYPHQGKLYSWNNTAGEIETGNGRMMHYEPLNSTSYGEPAGLFGINCGHYPIPIIPGVTIPHAQDFVQPKEENDRQYAESQQQRALERKIRAAKRALEMGDRSPDAKERVKAAQEEMRQFIKATGRTRRPDRESLYGGKKAPTPPKDQRPTPGSKEQATPQPATQPAKIELPPFTPAKTIEEAQEFAKQFVEKSSYQKIGQVNYQGLDLEYANEFNRALYEVLNSYQPTTRIRGRDRNGNDYEREENVLLHNIIPFNKREARFKGETAEAAYQWITHNMFYNKDYFKNKKSFDKHMKEIDEAKTVVMSNLDRLEQQYKNDKSMKGEYWRKYIQGLKDSGRSNVGVTPYIDIIHECGHYLDDTLFSKNYKKFGIDLTASYEKYASKISGYATATQREYIAESFTAYWIGEREKVDPDLIRLFDGVRKNE